MPFVDCARAAQPLSGPNLSPHIPLHPSKTSPARRILQLKQRRRVDVQAANGGGPEDNFNELRKWLGITPSKPNTPGPEGRFNAAEWSTDNLDEAPPNMNDINQQQDPDTRPFTNTDPPNFSSGSSATEAAARIINSLTSRDKTDGNQPKKPKPSAWTEWSAGPDEDWDDWSGAAIADLDDEEDIAELREQVIRRRQERRGKRTKVRDEYLRPIVDAQGIRNRLAFDERETEERVFVEAITNQYESREALKYGGYLIVVPLALGFIISRLVAQPVWSWAENLNPDAFAPRDEQKVDGAEEIHREEVRIRLEVAIGQAPPLTDEDMLQHLHQEAKTIETRIRENNRKAMLNVVSDSLSAATLFVLIVRDNSQRAILFRTLGRVFTGLSDTAKAFLIILTTDILLGYHSEEGWTAALKLISGHYGVSAEDETLHVFVATVPVLLDSLFKYWIFVELNKIDPAAAVTLRQMDRH